jgi:hypothetical protein
LKAHLHNLLIVVVTGLLSLAAAVGSLATYAFMHPVDAACLGLLAAEGSILGCIAALNRSPWWQRTVLTASGMCLLVAVGAWGFSGYVTPQQMLVCGLIVAMGTTVSWMLIRLFWPLKLVQLDPELPADLPQTWQFSIRHMMIVTTVVSALVASKQLVPPDGGQLLVCIMVSFCLVALGILACWTVLASDKPMLATLPVIPIAGCFGLLPPYFFNFLTNQLSPMLFWPIAYMFLTLWVGLLAGLMRWNGYRIVSDP